MQSRLNVVIMLSEFDRLILYSIPIKDIVNVIRTSTVDS